MPEIFAFRASSGKIGAGQRAYRAGTNDPPPNAPPFAVPADKPDAPPLRAGAAAIDVLREARFAIVGGGVMTGGDGGSAFVAAFANIGAGTSVSAMLGEGMSGE